MRPAYQSPASPPARRFLRRRPPESPERRKALVAAALLGAAFLVYTFVLSDTGLLRILAIRHETEELRAQKIDLAVRVHQLEERRKAQAADPLLEERVARERFHLVREGETLYRYQEPEETAR
ncbi:MAG TPA: septum formation initiator family protein [Candidatus Eisenbacteria bacterium]|nr:septum formation initiator family protein [Candidatus Eisenbacteria bacterium]